MPRSSTTRLNPIRAKADLSLYVLSYADLKPDHPGYTLFLAHQIAKEVFATSNAAGSAGNLSATLGVPLKL